MLHEKIDQAVKNSDMPISIIAEKCFIDEKVLYKIRKGQQQATADKVLRLATVLDNADLIRYQCSSCTIGEKFHLVCLDGNIRSQGHEILMKNKTEINEFLAVYEQMLEILFDKDTYTDEELNLIDKGLDEAIDVRHCVETLELWYAKKFGIEKLNQKIEDHNEKCIKNGYARG
ncbi:hypothetical protein [Abyssisolibacter fermentans]|uniref:hypothetical protein n=1 Tax=Abyssisolibacter fermentans TaxID=1766203 RepID=UPI00082FFA61|nr:hypothetical protein [Abyssisolibacter fermentans]